MTNNYQSVNTSNDYIESRRDRYVDIFKRPTKRKAKKDPGFVNAIQGYIKEPCSEKEERKRKIIRGGYG